ncbi:MAG TPA: lipid-A-disaccharide synthase [Candidatus Polarisedimenticolaceae bacterium]|nr:lipid-A-disaccharide synthase [Candidatus Polarisedimenticolaceae bacterium]
MSRAGRVMLSAGEASGDRLGAGLARALLERRPQLELFGMGGEQMAEAGVEVIQDASEVAVVGFSEVLAHLPALYAAKRRLESALAERAPDLLVPIDFPDFNFLLSARARRLDVPVVYFVSPQIWAWRRGRVRRIRRFVRRMLVLFPFEVDFYREAGVPVSFVGHPVAERPADDDATDEWRAGVGFDPALRLVALLPGSRRSEVDRLLPVMLAAAKRLATARDGLGFVIPLARGLDRRAVEARVAESGLRETRLVERHFPQVLRSCAAGVVASGTASLEAAVLGLPIVVVYRVGRFSYWIGRALVRVDHIALPNLVAQRRVVPELVQDDCTPQAIADAVASFLDDPGRVAQLRGELAEVERRLGGPGVFERAADAVLAELDAATGRTA